MKKVLSIILAVVMVVCALPFSLTASAEVTSGTTGDCTWTLDGGVLTISGNGAMGNYDSWSTYPPWGKSITKVIIEEGVTNIGEYSFYNCANLASVTIPSSVTSIGSLAFYNCTGLIRVDTPDLSAWLNIDFGSVSDNPTYYTKSLYVNGKSAKDIIIPDGITSIKDYAFYNCANITSVEIPNSVTSIGEETFYGCTGLTSATIPNSVTSIGGYAFYDCGELVNIDIPKSVTNIGEGAFFNCYGLTNVVIPNSIVSILARTFQFCSKLESVFIPKSVMNIANDAFYYDYNISDVWYEGSEDDKNNMLIGATNTYLLNATWHYNICQAENHSYASDCDTTCGNCEWVREAVAEHVFDNPCDTDCNNCGLLRETSHTYDNDGDATCNTCDYTREIVADYYITTDETIRLQYEAGQSVYFVSSDTTIAEVTDVSTSLSLVNGYVVTTRATISPIKPGYVYIYVTNTEGRVLALATILIIEGEHQLVFEEIVKEATCNEQGEELHKCKFCEYTETKYLETIPHTYDNSCDESCNACGEGRTVTHNFEWVVDAQENCGVNGVKHEECTLCHAKANENTVIPATGNHTGGEATCVAKAVCDVCGQSYGENDENNHKNTEVRDQTDLYTGDTYCLDCNQMVLQGEMIGEYGDVNSDEKINALDAMIISQYYVGIEVSINLKLADVNDDGKYNALDAMLISQFYVGLIETFPVEQ